jgi:hypothetical protein
MASPSFQEVQTLRQNPWIWVVLIVSLLSSTVPLAAGMYQQLGEGRPWGDKPMSDEGLVTLFFSMLVISLIAIAGIYSSTLQIKIDRSGITYKKSPSRKWTTIPLDQVEGYEVKKLNLFQAAAMRKFQRLEGRRKIVKLLSTTMVVVRQKNGNELYLGSTNPGEIVFTLKRLLSVNEI